MGVLGWLLLGAGIVGGALGIGKSLAKADYEETQLQTEHDNLEAQKDRDLELMQLQFDIAKDEANKNADNLDKSTDIQEKNITDQINNEIDALFLGQKRDVFDMNMANMGIDKAEADALTMSAASGTRTGGSNADAIELQKALNEAELQLNEDTRRNQTDFQLDNILGGLEMSKYGIGQNRENANNLRADFMEGGNQYELYQKQRANREAGYDVQIAKYNTALEENQNGWNRTADALGGFFSGFSGGVDFGSSVGNIYDKIHKTKKPGTDFDNVGGKA